MNMSDPIADMLTRIRNANTAKHDTVDVPASKMKIAIADILVNEGYIAKYDLVEDGVFKTLHITLKYGADKNEKVISGLKRISKPGLRVYANTEELPSVLGGFGIGDCYDIVLKLNGEIHFLNSIFSHSDSVFRNVIKEGVENSVNKELTKRIIFENNQILAIPKVDCVLSYFPLNDWVGKSTNTLCFHGYTDKHNLNENNVSCKSYLWENSPVNIKEIKNNFSNFKKLLSK